MQEFKPEVKPTDNPATDHNVQGQVLTRHAIYRHGQLVLQYYIKTAQGPVLAELYHSEVICFCRQQDVDLLSQKVGLVLKAESISLMSFAHEPISALYLKSNTQLKLVSRIAQDIGITLFETDIRPEQRFLIERFIALDIECVGRYQDMYSASSMPVLSINRARKIPADQVVSIPLKMISLDFECSFAGELYSVGLYGREYQCVFMVGEPQADCHQFITWVKDEVELIQRLIAWFSEYDPDIIIGWAVVTFDLALLYKRCVLHNIPLIIGRGNTELSWKVAEKYRPETLSLPGRVVLDGIDWLKAAFYQFDSFSLESVSRQLLAEGKAIDHVENRGQEITHLFEQDKNALAFYNITDCRLVWDIFEKTQLLDFALERAKLTGLEFGRVGASIAAFYHLYLPHLHRSGFVAPAHPASNGLESPGGYVMSSIPGYYKDVLVLDFKSLYPSIIRTFLIDPKGLVEGMYINDVTGDTNTVAGYLGAHFSRNSPILPALVASLAEQRELAKSDKNAPLSQAIKIIMNSLYGVLGSRGCVFHDAKLASSITMRGHQIMKLTKQWIEECGYQVIYGDTDSTFVWLGDNHGITDIQAVGKHLSVSITQRWLQWCTQEYQLDSYLELEFETHFEQFIMPTLRGSDEGSKKRYVGAVLNEAQQLELTFKGMEQVRSDWSPIARRMQYHLYELFFKGEDVIDYLTNELAAINHGARDNELIFTKRLRRNVEDYTAKSSPHVKAAKQLADILGDKNVTRKGQKIRYVMTLTGAQAIEAKPTNIDYEYYISKQIQPIAEPILQLCGHSFDSLVNNQLLLL
ncbi:DNA polymerase II [Shewanella sp. SR43-4]|uniref:DNA polymerase II n=1 Tax=Shewanella sp. SR43-4 TaxID=2760942 RepID=UPI0015F7ADCC|nr:DNA polymerase II [Shewanella sp. SR43-4]MBB1316709.1 DNA polymerase II [Shewanella sp. SR43-4]